jgi:hypothetical protein
MNKIITKEQVEQLLSINRDTLPLSAAFWEIETFDPDKEKNYFYFTSNKHFAATLMPVNFYKPITFIINFNETENL